MTTIYNLIKSNKIVNYNLSKDLVTLFQNLLIKSNYTKYVNGFPKNVKLQTSEELKNNNKFIIHHYRCHIHFIYDNIYQTITNNPIDIVFTLSHRFKYNKISNNQTHVYLEILSDNKKNDSIEYNLFLRKENKKKIKINISQYDNPELVISKLLFFENILQMTKGNFDFIKNPFDEKKLYDILIHQNENKYLDNENFRNNFFILRDFTFWCYLISHSIENLFSVLNYGILYLKNNNFNISNNKELIAFTKKISLIKNNNFPIQYRNIDKLNNLENFQITYNKIDNFHNYISEIIYTVEKLKDKLMVFSENNKNNDKYNDYNNFINTFYVILFDLKTSKQIEYFEVVNILINSVLLNYEINDKYIINCPIYNFIINNLFLCNSFESNFAEIEEFIDFH